MAAVDLPGRLIDEKAYDSDKLGARLETIGVAKIAPHRSHGKIENSPGMAAGFLATTIAGSSRTIRLVPDRTLLVRRVGSQRRAARFPSTVSREARQPPTLVPTAPRSPRQHGSLVRAPSGRA